MTKEEYWQNYDIGELCRNYSNDFDIWWDTDKFSWGWSIWLLFEYIPHKFDIWWNPEKFDWRVFSDKLCSVVPHKFNIWWDPKKFNWGYSWALCQYLPHRFDDWWDGRRRFRYEDTKYFILHIPNKIYKWGTYKKLNINLINKIINDLEWNYD